MNKIKIQNEETRERVLEYSTARCQAHSKATQRKPTLLQQITSTRPTPAGPHCSSSAADAGSTAHPGN